MGCSSFLGVVLGSFVVLVCILVDILEVVLAVVVVVASFLQMALLRVGVAFGFGVFEFWDFLGEKLHFLFLLVVEHCLFLMGIFLRFEALPLFHYQIFLLVAFVLLYLGFPYY